MKRIYSEYQMDRRKLECGTKRVQSGFRVGTERVQSGLVSGKGYSALMQVLLNGDLIPVT